MEINRADNYSGKNIKTQSVGKIQTVQMAQQTVRIIINGLLFLSSCYRAS